MNTGIISIENYGSTVPSRVSHLTFTHEIGHNFGSPHDSGSFCSPGESKTFDGMRDGNYIMYARATSGLKPNNKLFSPCSIANISAVLEVKSQACFIQSDAPICGNGIVDKPQEQCDCGFEDECKKRGDQCCAVAGTKEPGEKECQLYRKNNAKCSPSQGPCCGQDCEYKPNTVECAPESDCRYASYCSGFGYGCGIGQPKVDLELCANKTRVCRSGECTGSICEHYGLEACNCVPKNQNERHLFCHTCCMSPGDNTTCASTGSDQWVEFFQNHIIFLQPGSPCDNFEGYGNFVKTFFDKPSKKTYFKKLFIVMYIQNVARLTLTVHYVNFKASF